MYYRFYIRLAIYIRRNPLETKERRLRLSGSKLILDCGIRERRVNAFFSLFTILRLRSHGSTSSFYSREIGFLKLFDISSINSQ